MTTPTITIHDLELLSSGHNNQCVAMSPTLVGKVFPRQSQDVYQEFETLERAYTLCPALFPQPHTVEYTADYTRELLVMERLYPLERRAISFVKREKMFVNFQERILHIHAQGFLHLDIRRPAFLCTKPADMWNNVILTHEGIKLIDVGNSTFRDVNKLFPGEWEELQEEEQQDVVAYGKYLLEDPQ